MMDMGKGAHVRLRGAGHRTDAELDAAMAERFDILEQEQMSMDDYRDRRMLGGPGGLYAAVAGEFSTRERPLSWAQVRAAIRRHRRKTKG